VVKPGLPSPGSLRRLVAVAWLVALAAACNSASSTKSSPNAQSNSSPTSQWSAPAADPREPLLAQAVNQMLSGEHLRSRPIDDEVSRVAFGEYLERLDPSKTFLLAEHVAALREHSDQMDDQLRSGELTLGRLGAAMLASRQKVVGDAVARILAGPFDFTVDETIETDPDKLEHATTEAELAERWRKLLKLQALERIAQMEEMKKSLEEGGGEGKDADPGAAKALENLPETAEGRERKARADLAKSYAGRFSRLAKTEPLEPAETFLNAVASVFDPHTVYLAPADKENFDIQMSGSLEGIGAVLVEDDHYIKVNELVPGGASWRQGKLEVGDLILAVAQQGQEPVDVADMRINQVVKMIRGPKGTVVTLTVKKPDDRIQTISITRDIVAIEAAYARGAVLDLGPDTDKVGFIYLPSFYGNTRNEPGGTPQRSATDDVRKLLIEFEKRGLKGAVLDLRGNGGGLLDQARDITGMFIETGPVVQTRYSNDRSQVLADENPNIAFSGHVVVLVDRFSASASEIVAGALQDYRRALVAGTTTHGKGTVQLLVDLDRLAGNPDQPLGVLKLTIQQFFRVNGESTQWRGVVPDISLPDPTAHMETGERHLDHAIPWSKVDPLRFKPVSAGKWSVGELADASVARIAGSTIFDRLGKQSAYVKQRREQSLVPLEQQKWRAQRERDRTMSEELGVKLSDGPPLFNVALAASSRASSENGRIKEWQKNLARDPWVEETLRVMDDMIAARKSATR
jgi:carboxyl-terminal processing protease